MVTHLILITGVGGLKRVDSGGQGIDRFVQHNHPWRRIQSFTERIVLEALSEIGGVDGDKITPGFLLRTELLEAFLNCWINTGTLTRQRGCP